MNNVNQIKEMYEAFQNAVNTYVNQLEETHGESAEGRLGLFVEMASDRARGIACVAEELFVAFEEIEDELN